MTSSPGSETIIIRRAPLVANARHGGQSRDWSNAVDRDSAGWSVQPYQATEATTDREFTSTHWRAFGPYAEDLLVTDRIVFGGVVFDVDGEPQYWRDDAGTPDHIEAVLKRAVG